MRLLTKSEIATAKATDRSREVAEGIKLAKRVDGLREIQAQEQAALEKFRRESIATIHDEINAATQKRDTLKIEVDVLEVRKKEALRPLADAWEKIGTINKGLELERKELDGREEIVSFAEEQVTRTLRHADGQLHRANAKREQADKLVFEADNNRQKTEESLENARKLETSALQLRNAVTKELRERDTSMAAKERGVLLKEEWAVKEKEKIRIEWVKIGDQRKTLDRAFTRLKRK